jgi:formimidoylglutamate deiminase
MSLARDNLTRRLHFSRALMPGGWVADVIVTVREGTIADVQTGQTDVPRDVQRIPGVALPGMTNVHSHAFQRAMAGLTEYRTSQHDSFWTWRKLMYEFLEHFSPEDIYEIGRALYSEMLTAGYATVVEFHYLLQQPDGSAYANPNAMADALIHAALDAGIDICMLPVCYQRGGFDDSPLAGGQRRFGTTHDEFLEMLQKLAGDWSGQPAVRLGYALHSLRAVSVPAAQALLRDADSILPGCPIHIHVAEQTREVDDCLAFTGKRPVELLLDSFDIDSRWCLIHATHLSDDELRMLALSGAVAGVCPTTEANLGDGVFRAEDYRNAGGRLAIGGDSHVAVDVRSELRMIEYAQRLTTQRRAVLCSGQQSCGTLLYQWTASGGAAVSGFGPAAIEVGNRARFSVIDPAGISAEAARIMDAAIFQDSPRSPGIHALTNGMLHRP